jgi:hypothetical protein
LPTGGEGNRRRNARYYPSRIEGEPANTSVVRLARNHQAEIFTFMNASGFTAPAPTRRRQ